jgi:hypothetical protein
MGVLAFMADGFGSDTHSGLVTCAGAPGVVWPAPPGACQAVFRGAIAGGSTAGASGRHGALVDESFAAQVGPELRRHAGTE